MRPAASTAALAAPKAEDRGAKPQLLCRRQKHTACAWPGPKDTWPSQIPAHDDPLRSLQQPDGVRASDVKIHRFKGERLATKHLPSF